MTHIATVADLPQVPFSLYFIKDMEIFPKQMFTVTRKSEDGISLYIAELETEVVYDYYRMDVVAKLLPN